MQWKALVSLLLSCSEAVSTNLSQLSVNIKQHFLLHLHKLMDRIYMFCFIDGVLPTQ